MKPKSTSLLLMWTMIILGTPQKGNPSMAEDTTASLHALFEEEWEYDMQQSPTRASALGDRRYNDRWPDVSRAAIDRRQVHYEKVLAKLQQFEETSLSEPDRLNLSLFRREYENRIEQGRHRWFRLPLDQRGGIQTANQLADRLRFRTVKDYEDWIGRLRSFPTYMDQTIALMTEGVENRMVQAKVVMQRVPDQISSQITLDPTMSFFFEPFETFSEEITETDRKRLIDEATAAIRENVVPSYRKFLEFFESKYLPACFDRVGIWQMPGGKEIYASRAKMYTTTNLTPEEIHKIGLREVERIRKEMGQVIEEVGFEGSFSEFLTFLRTDPQFQLDDPQKLLSTYRAVSKRIDPLLVKLFRTMPRMPYGVEPIPASIAPDTTTAYYSSPAADGSRAGTYFVNLFRPETRPTYEMEALSLHEAVPGHHFQIALAMELGKLPKFRRYGGYTAYIEGWALYCESLGKELGLYQDPYSYFGRLTYEIWRAIRLVVDTGIHDFGWTREKAIGFFMANAAKSKLDITNEIDRYISWPGQALAYKIGELKIQELRDRATQRLGKGFDLKEFHDVVLLSGAVPLDVLEEKIDRWINQVKKTEQGEPQESLRNPK